MFEYAQIPPPPFVPLVRHSKSKFSWAVMISVVNFAQTNGHKNTKHKHKVVLKKETKKMTKNTNFASICPIRLKFGQICGFPPGDHTHKNSAL